MVSKSQLENISMNNVEFVAIFAAVILFSISIPNAFAQTEPDRPINLFADDISPTKIDLSWDAPSDDGGESISGYKIEFKILPGNYQVLVPYTGNNSTTYSHSGLQSGITYFYRVFAINSIGTSVASLEDTAKPTASSSPPDQIPPNPPTQLNATDVSSTQIDLAWLKPVDNESPAISGYKIERKTSTSSYSTLVENAGTATKYSDTNVITDTNYIYRIFAINSVGDSDPSNEATATPTESSAPPPQQIVPNKPTSLSVELLSPTELIISWKEPAENEGPIVTGYRIEVKHDSEEYSVAAENIGLDTKYIQTSSQRSNTLTGFLQ